MRNWLKTWIVTMAPTPADDGRKPPLDRRSLLERILIARPDATLEDIRRIAPLFQDTGDKQLENQIARLKQRIASKRAQKIQRRR